MTESIEEKLKNFREHLLDEKYPLGIDEILGEVEYLFEDDKEVSKIIDKYQKDYSNLWDCAERFYKIKKLLDIDG